MSEVGHVYSDRAGDVVNVYTVRPKTEEPRMHFCVSSDISDLFASNIQCEVVDQAEDCHRSSTGTYERRL